MNHCRLSGSFSVFRLLLPAVMLVVLAGCSSSMSRVETWQGNPAQAVNAATLKAPGEIRVTQVNGRSVGNFLMDDLALDYALLPGRNDVVFVYKTIWAKTTVVDNGESKVEIVESEPQLVSFDAKAGTVYEFRFDKPATRREAERKIKDFSAEIVTSAGQVATVSTKYAPSQALARTPIPGTAGAQATSAAAQGNALDTLKAVWASASDEEKKNFLRWAFE
ncbi:MAG: DUF2057 family protein [Marinobacter sp.]